MVVNYLPVGMTGLIIAVLVAALISSVDSGLNSFSTIFTLDIYSNKKENTDPGRIKMIGRIVTVCAAIIAILFALAMTTLAKDLFTLLQSIIAFIAPPMSAVFLVGALWKKATPASSIAVLTAGAVISLGTGFCQIKKITFGLFEEWPHFLLLSFFLFILMVFIMVITSLVFPDKGNRSGQLIFKNDRPTSSENRTIWLGWTSLAVIMFGIYLLFQTIG
jgi:SSS family solute:Na+ symporter